MSISQIIQLVAVASALFAALTLFYGSIGIPAQRQSWKGATWFEQRWRRRQRALKWIGLPSAVLSASCQIVAILWPSI